MALALGLAWAPGATARAQDAGSVSGLVMDPRTSAAQADVEITLTCACLPEPLVRRTNASGLYLFAGLGPGAYTLRVQVGAGSMSKSFELAQGMRYRVSLRVDPRVPEHRRVTVLRTPPSTPWAAWRVTAPDRSHVVAPLLLAGGLAMVGLATGLGTHYGLAWRDGIADDRSSAELRPQRDAMIASFVVPGAIGVGAVIAGAYGLARTRQLRRHPWLPYAPWVGRALVGLAVSGRF